MTFSSTIFLFFFLPSVLLFYYLAPNNIMVKNTILLMFSLFFYAWGEPVNIILLFYIIILNYFLAIKADTVKLSNQNPDKVPLKAITFILNLAPLFYFKYLHFSLSIINKILARPINISKNISLPIGISFLTFQAISYVVDVINGKEKAQKNLVNVGLYFCFFPQLIAGPISRYEIFANELSNRTHTLTDFSNGIYRFMVGLSKKCILSDSMSVVANFCFSYSANISPLAVWLGAIAYTFQIYYDFSGYSDMAIGLGKQFGFDLPENFDYPYVSKTLSEFWRRWHMSLGNWFRDYVYIPLGGSRYGTKKTIRNLFVVWIFTGLWHGANWTFIVWGLFNFFIIVIEKYLGLTNKADNSFKKMYAGACFLFIVIGWVLFRSSTLHEAYIYLEKMSLIFASPLSDSDYFIIRNNLLIFLICALFSTPIVPIMANHIKSKHPRFYKYTYFPFRLCSFLLLCILSIICVISSTFNPFIYFNF